MLLMPLRVKENHTDFLKGLLEERVLSWACVSHSGGHTGAFPLDVTEELHRL